MVWQNTITTTFFESSIKTLHLALTCSYFYMFGQIGPIFVFYAQKRVVGFCCELKIFMDWSMNFLMALFYSFDLLKSVFWSETKLLEEFFLLNNHSHLPCGSKWTHKKFPKLRKWDWPTLFLRCKSCYYDLEKSCPYQTENCKKN